jgi:hypothetical protein
MCCFDDAVADAWNDSGACEVVLARGGERQGARLRWWARWNEHRIELHGSVGVFSGSGPDQFEALVDLRRSLDETGWLIAVPNSLTATAQPGPQAVSRFQGRI